METAGLSGRVDSPAFVMIGYCLSFDFTTLDINSLNTDLHITGIIFINCSKPMLIVGCLHVKTRTGEFHTSMTLSFHTVFTRKDTSCRPT